MGDTTIEQPVIVEELPKIGKEIVQETLDEIVKGVENVILQDVITEDKTEILDDNASEYESVGSVDEELLEIEISESEANLINEEHSENEEHLGDELEEGEVASDESVSVEREEGDGQESVPSKKIDDDEDKKNPQYIPKRGTFYEHDDRTLDDENEDEETLEKTEKQNKKNIWMEKKEKWSHDRFDDKQQAPKSRSELVSVYGYDIRNEDGPPRARRRRRYGRGPNKYTRTWEDEDAYKPAKPTKPTPRKPRREDQEYPELESTGNRRNNTSENETSPRINTTQETTRPNYVERPTYNENNIKKNNTNVQASNNRPPQVEYSNKQVHHKPGTGRVNNKPRPEFKKEIKDSDYMGMTRTRQYRNSKFEQKVLPRGFNKETQENTVPQNNKVLHNLEEDLSNLSVQDSAPKNSNKPNNSRQASIPPRMQVEQKGSKRYSSLRQRSLPETAAPPFNPQVTSYFNSDYNQGQPPQPQQALLPQPPQIHTTQVSQIVPSQLPSIQTPVGAASILQAPPQYGAPFPPAPPAYLQPAVPPTPYIPQQPPPLINYVQGQPPFTQPAPFQHPNYQQFNAATQPAELYQCQGGTTYYSTQSQQLGQRMIPIRRPKAAIPIVPPPTQDARNLVKNEGAIEDEMYERIENVNNCEETVYVLQ